MITCYTLKKIFVLGWAKLSVLSEESLHKLCQDIQLQCYIHIMPADYVNSRQPSIDSAQAYPIIVENIVHECFIKTWKN